VPVGQGQDPVDHLIDALPFRPDEALALGAKWGSPPTAKEEPQVVPESPSVTVHATVEGGFCGWSNFLVNRDRRGEPLKWHPRPAWSDLAKGLAGIGGQTFDVNDAWPSAKIVSKARELLPLPLTR